MLMIIQKRVSTIPRSPINMCGYYYLIGFNSWNGSKNKMCIIPLYPIIKYTLGFLIPVNLFAFVTCDFGSSAK